MNKENTIISIDQQSLDISTEEAPITDSSIDIAVTPTPDKHDAESGNIRRKLLKLTGYAVLGGATYAFKQTNDALQSELAGKTLQISGLTSEKNRLRSERDTLGRERSMLSEKSQEQQKQIVGLDHLGIENARLKEEIEKLKKNNSELQERNIGLTEANRKLTGEILDLREWSGYQEELLSGIYSIAPFLKTILKKASDISSELKVRTARGALSIDELETYLLNPEEIVSGIVDTVLPLDTAALAAHKAIEDMLNEKVTILGREDTWYNHMLVTSAKLHGTPLTGPSEIILKLGISLKSFKDVSLNLSKSAKSQEQRYASTISSLVKLFGLYMYPKLEATENVLEGISGLTAENGVLSPLNKTSDIDEVILWLEGLKDWNDKRRKRTPIDPNVRPGRQN